MIESEQNFELVEPMGEQLGQLVIKEMLANISRSITPDQMSVVNSALKICNSALYVRLVFDQIRLWRSYTTDMTIQQGIDEMIEEVFGRVETAHGKVHFSN